MSDMLYQSTEVKAGSEALDALARKLAGIPGALEKVLLRTVNRAGEGGITDAVKLIAGHYALKQREIRESFYLKKGSLSVPVAVIKASGPRALPLTRWNPSPGPGGKRPPVGLRVRVLRGGAAKPVPGAFWMPTGGSHTIMKREGKERLPLEKLFGPSFMTYYRRPDVQEQVKARIAERVLKVLPQQIRFVLKVGKEGPDA